MAARGPCTVPPSVIPATTHDGGKRGAPFCMLTTREEAGREQAVELGLPTPSRVQTATLISSVSGRPALIHDDVPPVRL